MSETDLTATPGQTVGPFFGYALPYVGGPDLVPPGHPSATRLHGYVLDGRGQPVPDAMLEIWQADSTGIVPREAGSLRRDGHTFTGWGRAATDNTGHYGFTTVEPAATDPGTPAFICLVVFARGLPNRLFTRVYVPAQGGATDRLLDSLPPDRRGTLLASRDGQRSLRFDVRLQGEGETVFLAYPGS